MKETTEGTNELASALKPIEAKRQMVEDIIREIVLLTVLDREVACVTASHSGNLSVVSVRVADADYGKVLGPKRTGLDAIKLIMAQIGSANDLSVFVDLEDPVANGRASRGQLDPTVIRNLVFKVASNALKRPVKVILRDFRGTIIVLIQLHPDEPAENTSRPLREAFETVFNGIGRTNGMRVHIAFDTGE